MLAEISTVRAATPAIAGNDTDPSSGDAYPQVLHRGLGLMGTFSTSFAQQGVMASTTLLFGYGLSNGGPAVMLYVWLIGSLLACITGACLAEICSKLPYAGSVYHWAGHLAPPGQAPIASYWTGWLNLLGNAASSVGYSYGFGQFVSALYNIDAPVPLSPGATVGIAMAGTVTMAFVNILRIDIQGSMNTVNMIFSLGSLIAVCACLMLSGTPKHTLYWAFTTTTNTTGFDNFGYVVLTATLTLLFGVAGYEASAHLAEETRDPRTVAPWGMVFNIFTTCVFGFIYLLVLLLCIPTTGIHQDDVTDDGLNYVMNSDYANDAIAVFVATVGKRTAAALTVLIVIMAFMAGLANMTITARVGYAMARDGAFPGSKWLSVLNSHSQSPVNMILAILVFDFVLLLVPLGNQLAFTAVTSISTIGYQISYLIPIVMRLTAGTFEQDEHFNLGCFSVPLHIISAIFLFVTGGFMFLPQSAPVSEVETFNWAIPVTPFFVIVGLIYWEMYAKYYFKGPAEDYSIETLHKIVDVI